MNIRVICVGKLKEKFWQEACAEYLKRITGFTRIEIVELKEAKLPKNASPADEQAVIEKESQSILDKIQDRDYVIAMDLSGKQEDSVEFAKSLSAISLGNSTIDFVIGGSLGLSDSVRKRADKKMSFSEMTFPHQLFRVMLLEQIYRAFKIINNETYHK
jgi:23S rRNA (pseudouridine1915-N3)-methyltransferase